MTLYRRRSPETWEEIAAAAAGVAVGLAVFYVARLWLQREPLEVRPPTPPVAGASELRDVSGPTLHPQPEDAEGTGYR